MKIFVPTLCLLTIIAVAQAQSAMTKTRPDPWTPANSTAPVVWQRYKVSERNVSFLLPKMPLVHTVPHMCGEMRSLTYLAYAEGAIYEVVIAGPRRSATQVNCGGKIVSYTPRKLEERLAELRNDNRLKEKTVEINGSSVIEFRSDRSMRWIFANPNTRAKWIELAVAHYQSKVPDVTRFTESLQHRRRTVSRSETDRTSPSATQA
jgi:hypothetical protein